MAYFKWYDAPVTTLRTHSLAIAALLIICALAVSFKIGHIGLTDNSDYESYIATAQVFAGLDATHYPSRLLKPLAPLVVTALAPIGGFPTAFLIEIIFFYFAFALVLYWLAYVFFEDRWLAFLATLLGALSYPLMRYGLDLYTETGADFFYILSLALTLLYLKLPTRKLLVLNGFALGIGLLWKEYSVVAGLIFGLVLLLENVSWRARITNLALLALISLAPTILVQIWIYLGYHYTYFNWYEAGGASGFSTQFTLHNLIKSTAALLGLAWFLVPFGMWRWGDLTIGQRRFLAYAVLPPFIVLAWGYVSSRLFYVIAPVFVLLAIAGIAHWPRWLQVVAVGIVLLANIAWLVIATA